MINTRFRLSFIVYGHPLMINNPDKYFFNKATVIWEMCELGNFFFIKIYKKKKKKCLFIIYIAYILLINKTNDHEKDIYPSKPFMDSFLCYSYK